MRSPLLLLLSHFTSWVSTPILIDLIPPRSLREGGRYEGEEEEGEGGRGRKEGGRGRGRERGEEGRGGGVEDERQVQWRRNMIGIGGAEAV